MKQNRIEITAFGYLALVSWFVWCVFQTDIIFKVAVMASLGFLIAKELYKEIHQ